MHYTFIASNILLFFVIASDILWLFTSLHFDDPVLKFILVLHWKQTISIIVIVYLDEISWVLHQFKKC